jgi:eukaryotic-like serine/threonine-protein kinase
LRPSAHPQAQASGQLTAADRLFGRALERPDEEREHFVRTEATDDHDLVILTLELLRAEAASRTFFETGVPALDREALAAALAGPERADPGDQRVGRYRLSRRLGHGGAAVVHLGQRDDGEFSQQVAVKLLRRMVVTTEEVLRFMLERQILSTLDHPHIARLIDGGTLPDGQPFLVTEFVDGPTITDHASRQRLDVPSRLALFLQVAEAVHHAHSKRVIHRDIKPSNVLVDREGRVRLLDFGIAKRLDADPSQDASLTTRAGQRPMTPAYAAPEQLAGGEITTATDIYQLGVLLHELLTGERPRGAPGQPVAPASGLDAGLRAILQKALQADPARRYASAAALADDLRRYRNGEALQARPERGFQTLWREMRNHPMAAAALALSALVLVGWLASSQHYTRELAAQRDQATAQANQTRRAYDLLTSVLRQANPLDAQSQGGRQVTIWEALDGTAAQTRSQLPEDPTTRAEVLDTLASLYRAGGRYEQARALLEDALAARIQAEGPDAAATALAWSALGSLERQAGRNDEARAHLARAVSLASALPPEQARQALAVWLRTGFAALDDGDATTARLHFERAAGLLEGDAVADPGTRIEALFGLATTRLQQGDAEAAQAPARQAVDLADRHFGPDHPRLAGPLSAWGNVQRRLGRPEQAADALRRAISLLEREYGAASDAVLAARNNLALALEASGRWALAATELAAVLAQRQTRGDRVSLADAHQNLGATLTLGGHPEEALQHLAQARAIYDRELPARSPRRAYPRLSAALAGLEAGQPAEAARVAAEAIAILEQALPPGHAVTAVGRCLHGEARLGLGEQAIGSRLVREALVDLRGAPASLARHVERCTRVAAGLPAG